MPPQPPLNSYQYSTYFWSWHFDLLPDRVTSRYKEVWGSEATYHIILSDLSPDFATYVYRRRGSTIAAFLFPGFSLAVLWVFLSPLRMAWSSGSVISAIVLLCFSFFIFILAIRTKCRWYRFHGGRANLDVMEGLRRGDTRGLEFCHAVAAQIRSIDESEPSRAQS